MRSQNDDTRLPKVFEGLVLVCEGFSGIGLAVQGRRDEGVTVEGGDEEMVRQMKVDIVKPIVGQSSSSTRISVKLKTSRYAPAAF